MYSAVRVIPVLLLSDDGLVKTTKFQDRRYIGDPINTVKIFNEKEVDELVILDIDATKRGYVDYELVASIVSEAFMPIAYGGGVSTLEDIEKLIRLGIEKIIINNALFQNQNTDFIKQAVSVFGSQAIVAGIDVKKNLFGSYVPYTHSGSVKQLIKFEEHLKTVIELGVGEVLINDIARDGTMQGYDIKLIELVTDKIELPVVICGGAKDKEDLLNMKSVTNVSGLGVGSLFIYYGKHKAVLISYLNREELKCFERVI